MLIRMEMLYIIKNNMRLGANNKNMSNSRKIIDKESTDSKKDRNEK
jgi:hypothetical protein